MGKNNLLTKRGEKIAVGVSGGADSMALAMLARNWTKKYQIKLITFTVDHGLRLESKFEVNLVKNIMKKNDITHKTLVWKGIKPQSGIQEKARTARYKLLAEACIKNNAKYILLGHHKDDQIETFIMRLTSNSGLDGLSCMSSENYLLTEAGPIKIIRPLLDINKKCLIEFCTEQKIKWINDPSNKNFAYRRTQIRSINDSQINDDFYKTIIVYKKLKKSFNSYVENFIQDSFVYNKNGICQFSREKFIRCPYIIQERFLKKIFFSIGGKTYPPKTKTIKRIIKNICSKKFSNATAGKVFFDIDNKVITVLRQPEPLIKHTPLLNKVTLWDKRFMVEVKFKSPDLSIGPLGEKDYVEMRKLKKVKKSDIHYYAVKTLPTIRSLDEIVCIPHLSYSKSKYWEKNIRVKYLYDKWLHLIET